MRDNASRLWLTLLRLLSFRAGFQTVGLCITAFVSIVVARALGPEGRGALTVLTLVPYLAAMVLSLGVNDAMPYLRHRNGISQAQLRFLSWVIVGGLGVPAACVLAVTLYVHSIDWWGFATTRMVATMVAALLVMRVISILGKGLLVCEARLHELLWLDFCESLLLAIIVGGLSMSGALSLQTSLTAYLASASLPSAWLVRNFAHRGDARKNTLSHLVFPAIRYGIKTQLRVLGNMISQRADFFLVATLIGPAAVGTYAVANTIAEVAMKIPDAVSWIVLPRTAAMTDAEGHAFALNALALAVPATVVVGAALIIVGPVAIETLLGDSFAGAAPLLSWLTVGAVASTAYKILGSYFLASGRASVVAAATWVSAVVMLIADLGLLPILGLRGAAIAAAIGYGSGSLYTAFFFVWHPTSVASSPRSSKMRTAFGHASALGDQG
jgi:O-antigen/teichoic acid export membrane protein